MVRPEQKAIMNATFAISHTEAENLREGVAELRPMISAAGDATCTVKSADGAVVIKPELLSSMFNVLARLVDVGAAAIGRAAGYNADLLVKIDTLAAGGKTDHAKDAGPAEFTPQEAAAALRMSRPTVMRLIEKGVLPARKVGTHYRLPRAQVLVYRDNTAKVRNEALGNLTRMTEEFDF